jgi:hypothetical protein
MQGHTARSPAQGQGQRQGQGQGQCAARTEGRCGMRDNCDSDGTHSTQQTSGSFVPSVLAYSTDIVI